MEMQLQQQIEQKHRVEADLMAVRDLCVKLDQQKDTLTEQLGDKDTIKVHVNLFTFYSIHFYFLHFSLSISPCSFSYSTRRNFQDCKPSRILFKIKLLEIA